MEIHHTEEMHPDKIPANSTLLFYKEYTVQDIKIQSFNTKYRRSLWKTPDGNLIYAQLPAHIKGHFGNELKCYIISMHYGMHVPQNKIHSFLLEIGVQISAGEIDRILSSDKEEFHKEKEEILETGLKISPFIVADDTGLRHKGINGYCTHIGNDLFAYFKSSDRKNRINFLKTLGGANFTYYISGFSIAYFKKQHLTESPLKLLERARGREFTDESQWCEFLKRLGRIYLPGLTGFVYVNTVNQLIIAESIFKGIIGQIPQRQKYLPVFWLNNLAKL